MLKKTVVHIVHNLQVGGVETAVRSSIDQLNQSHNFWVVTLHPNDAEFIKQVKFNTHIKCFNLHSIWAPIHLMRLLFFVIQLKPELIITSLWKSHGVGLLIKAVKPQIPFITLIHSSAFFHVLDKYFTVLAVKKAVLVLADSSSSQKFVLQFNPKAKVEVLSFILQFTQTNQSHLPEFAERKMNAVFVGRMAKEKRLDRVLRLMAALKSKGIAINLTLYGPDHQSKNQLNELASELGVRVEFKGPLPPDEVPTELAKYQFFIQLSDVEGMAISVVQAMQQGLIPVVTKVGEMQYYVKHLYNGIVVELPFDELESTASLLANLCSTPEQLASLSKHAYQTFLNKPIYASHLDALIRRVLGE